MGRLVDGIFGLVALAMVGSCATAELADTAEPAPIQAEDLALGGLFVPLASVALYDADGNRVASADAAGPDGLLHLADVPHGIYYLDAYQASGGAAYSDAGRLAFAPVVAAGDAALRDGPFDLDFLDHPALEIAVGPAASDGLPSRLRVVEEAAAAMGGGFAGGCIDEGSCWTWGSRSRFAIGAYAAEDPETWQENARGFAGHSSGLVSCRDENARRCSVRIGSADVENYADQVTTTPLGLAGSHGGQCKFFQNLLLRRSGQYDHVLPVDWVISGTPKADGPSPLATEENIEAGDVLRISSGPVHSAIVVAYDAATRVALVVDSNYAGGSGHEAIGAHELTFSATPNSPSNRSWNTYRNLKCVYGEEPCRR